MKRIKIALLLLIITACRHAHTSMLPFYNGPDFTPQWIEPNGNGYAQIHRILPFSLTDQEGRTISNKNVQGKIGVVNFFFTTCGSICPRMMRNLAKVDSAFAATGRVRLLSHTVLPSVDSVPRLNAYALKRGIDARRWWLLTGSKDSIYRLARASYFVGDSLGTGGGDFLHTENCVLIDAQGRIRGIYNATLELEMDELIAHIRQLMKEEEAR